MTWWPGARSTCCPRRASAATARRTCRARHTLTLAHPSLWQGGRARASPHRLAGARAQRLHVVLSGLGWSGGRACGRAAQGAERGASVCQGPCMPSPKQACGARRRGAGRRAQERAGDCVRHQRRPGLRLQWPRGAHHARPERDDAARGRAGRAPADDGRPRRHGRPGPHLHRRGEGDLVLTLHRRGGAGQCRPRAPREQLRARPPPTASLGCA